MATLNSRRMQTHTVLHTLETGRATEPLSSLMISNGEDIVRMSRLMGHATASFTLNVYSHMLPREHDPSGDRLASLVFGNKLETVANLPTRLDGPSVENLSKSVVRMVAMGGIEYSAISAIFKAFPNSENSRYPEGYPGHFRGFFGGEPSTTGIYRSLGEGQL